MTVDLSPPDTTRPAPATGRPAIDRTAGSPPVDGHGLFKSLMLRLPRNIRRSLDHEQLLALREAAEELAWSQHTLDIRLSLPTPLGRRYLVVVGGRERRDPLRLAAERARHPLVRVGNALSLTVFACLLLGFGAFIGLALLALLYA